MSAAKSAWRNLMVSAAMAAALVLTGCKTDGIVSTKAMKPLSPQMLAEIEKKDMAKDSPVLVRIFKEESEAEIWKQDRTGHYALLKTYPVCRWSGELGPKIKEGDRQAPEGFYTITQAQMNPNSQYFLSFNIGYPNEFDRAHNRTGAHLMVHGDCSSRGCYAMTDDQIGEIYALARESFFGGQRSFQVQAYPFRMTALNMAKHRNNPHLAFWKMLKKGSDHFEVTRAEPKVNVCEKRYVFDAQAPAGAAPLSFSPAGRCPAYEIDSDVASAVAEKESRDQARFAELVKAGTTTVAVRTGRDGGMHPTFLAKIQPREVRDRDGEVHLVFDENEAKNLGKYVNPPRDPAPAEAEIAIAEAPMPRRSPLVRQTAEAPAPRAMSLAAAEPKPADAQSAAARSSPSTLARVGSTVSRWIGFGGQETTAAVPQAQGQTSRVAAAGAPVAPKPIRVTTPGSPQAKSAELQPQAGAKPQLAQAGASPAPLLRQSIAPQPVGSGSFVSGAQPVVQSDTFESRFGAR